MHPRRLLSVGTSALVLAVIVLAARYRAVIGQVAGTVAAVAVVLAAAVVLVAVAGWALSGWEIVVGRRMIRTADSPGLSIGATPDGRARLAPAAGLTPDVPALDLCVRGCGRPAEPWDIAGEWDGTAGHLLPGRPGLCAQCASRVAADVRPYEPFPPSADNRPPTPDPAFDAFAAEHQELQP